MTKLDTLFDKNEGKLNRQVDIEHLYIENGVDFEPDLREALAVILKNTTPKKYRGRGFMANIMNWTMIGHLIEKYPERMRVDSHQRNYYALDRQTRIYFKKLDKYYRPNNIPTNHVREMNSMGLLFKENPTTVLYAGFRIRQDQYWDDISCYLVEMKNMKTANWVSDLSDLSIAIAKSKSPVSPISKASLPDKLVVTMKSNKRKKTGGDKS